MYEKQGIISLASAVTLLAYKDYEKAYRKIKILKQGKEGEGTLGTVAHRLVKSGEIKKSQISITMDEMGACRFLVEWEKHGYFDIIGMTPPEKILIESQEVIDSFHVVNRQAGIAGKAKERQQAVDNYGCEERESL